MKIEAGKILKTLKGQDFQLSEGVPLTLGDVIAEAVASDATGGKFKMWSLAVSASKGEDFDVDVADLALIKTALNNCKSYGGQNIAVIGQAIGMLEDVR